MISFTSDAGPWFPVDDFEQRAADISVEHPDLVELLEIADDASTSDRDVQDVRAHDNVQRLR